VLAVDVDRPHLDFAAELGADDGVPFGPDAADGIVAANGGRKVDVVFDFVGAQQSLDLAAAVTGRGERSWSPRSDGADGRDGRGGRS